MPYLTPDAISPIETIRFVRVSTTSQLLGAVTDAIAQLSGIFNWQQDGALTPQQVADYFAQVAADMLVSSMIGTILPYASQTPPTFGLACDGSIYNRVDYPLLYAAIDPIYHIDADTFSVPDLRGRVILGAGAGVGLTPRAVGDVGGEEAHVLTIAELAAHTHGYTAPLTDIDLEGIGAPIPAATINPLTQQTGSAGSDQAHNTMPPFVALGYCIVAF